MSKIVYVAHPISGNIEANLKDLCRILRVINMNQLVLKFRLDSDDIINETVTVDAIQYDFSGIIPCAPYYADIIALDDTIAAERKRGVENDITLIQTGMFDELWLTGDKLSFGMIEEVKLFQLLGKPVVNYIGKI